MAGDAALSTVRCMLEAINWAGQMQDEAQRVTGVILQEDGGVHCQDLHANACTLPELSKALRISDHCDMTI